MTTSITSSTTTINTTMMMIMITIMTVMTNKILRSVYLGANVKYEDELKRQLITSRYSVYANACRISFDLIIAHGCLHLVPKSDWVEMIARMKANTVAGGYNIVVVLTDRIPPPADIAPFTVGLFHER